MRPTQIPSLIRTAGAACRGPRALLLAIAVICGCNDRPVEVSVMPDPGSRNGSEASSDDPVVLSDSEDQSSPLLTEHAREVVPVEKGRTPEEAASFAPSESELRQAVLARAIAGVLTREPELADEVCRSLPAWDLLSAHEELREGIESARDTGDQAPLLAALDHCRSRLAPESLARLYDHGLARARSQDRPAVERQVALKAACHVTDELHRRTVESSSDRGELDEDRGGDAVAPAGLALFLRAAAADSTEDPDLRRLAVRNLGALRCSGAAGIFATIIESDEPADLQAAAIQSMLKVDPSRAVEASTALLGATRDDHLFCAAALVLGRAQTTPALQALVDHATACPPDSHAIRAAVRYHFDWIADELGDPSSEELLLALSALPFCQSLREDSFKPALFDLLRRGELDGNPQVARLVLGGLIRARLAPQDSREILAILKERSFDAETWCPEEHKYLDRMARSVRVLESRREVR